MFQPDSFLIAFFLVHTFCLIILLIFLIKLMSIINAHTILAAKFPSNINVLFPFHYFQKVEEWENEAEGKTDEEIQREIDEVNAELYPKQYQAMQHRRRNFYRVINNKMIRFNNVGHPFVYELRKHGITGGLTDEEKQMAKEEWEKIQRNLPDNSTFDPPYRRSSESEFKQ